MPAWAVQILVAVIVVIGVIIVVNVLADAGAFSAELKPAGKGWCRTC